MTLYSLSIDGCHITRFSAEDATDAARHEALSYDARGTAVLIESVPDALAQFAGELSRAEYPTALLRGRLARLGFYCPPHAPLAETAEVYRRAAASEGTDPAHRPILARIAALIEEVTP